MVDNNDIVKYFNKYIYENNVVNLIENYQQNQDNAYLLKILFKIHVLRISKYVEKQRELIAILKEKLFPIKSKSLDSDLIDTISLVAEVSLRMETSISSEFQTKFEEDVLKFDSIVAQNFINPSRYIFAFFYHETLASYYCRTRNFKLFKERINLLYVVSDLIEDPILSKLSDFYFGLYYQLCGQYDLALKYLVPIEVIFTENNLYNYLALTNNSLGLIYAFYGYYEKSISYLNRVKEFYLSTDNQVGLIMTYHNLGVIFEDTESYVEAIDNYKKALNFQLNLDNSLHLGIIYFNLFLCYFKTNESMGAKIYLDLLEKFCHQNKYQYIIDLHALAEVYYKLLKSNLIEKIGVLENLKKLAFTDKVYSSPTKMTALLIYCKEYLSYYLSSQNDIESKTSEYLIEELEEIISEINKVNENGHYPVYEIQKLYLETYLHIANLDLDNAKKKMDSANKNLLKLKPTFEIIVPKPEFEEVEIKEQDLEKRIFNPIFSDSINTLIHALPRLNIMIYLYNENYATFSELKQNLQMTSGNLGRHCELLVNAGFILKTKKFVKGRLTTMYSISPEGIGEFINYQKTVSKTFI